ncbi:MAG: CopG family transcriptional regulator [Deltaproteobacteria bacterium]|nr:MAG: CopG family transcriptional regulator [Deltaproteobacteria bacterium]
MIRTQISLSEWEYKEAKKTAKQMGLSLAALLRRSLQSVLPASPEAKEKPWMKYAGMVNSGNPRSSQEIDDVVYGKKT